MKPIDVSVAVCTYNRAEMLRAALESLARLETGGRFTYEIVAVDNASTDHTPEVIERFAAECPVPFTRALEPRQGIAEARNRALDEARGEWIVYFDDDQVADPGWLTALLETARQTGARCIGGAVHLLLPAGSPEDLPAVCRRMLGESLGEPEPCRYNRKLTPATGNVAFHRTVFNEIGRFDESLVEGGEDADLIRRMRLAGIDAWYTPHAKVSHIIPEYRLSTDYFRWTNRRHGRHVARRDRQITGNLLFPLVLLARIGQAALLYLPRYLWAVVRRNPGQRLAGQCLLWRSEGFLRAGLHDLAPWLFPQRRFFQGLEFRSGRETLTHHPTVAESQALSCTK
jgi:GT2 family glycosyltransferase